MFCRFIDKRPVCPPVTLWLQHYGHYYPIVQLVATGIYHRCCARVCMCVRVFSLEASFIENPYTDIFQTSYTYLA